MIQMVSVLGPSIYNYTNGYDVTIGAVEVVNQSSGKMVMVKAASSCRFEFLPSSMTGNIVTIKAYDKNSGFLDATTSHDFSTVEIAVIADGY